MKISMKKMFLFLAIIASLTVVQFAWAHVESIEGPYTVNGAVAYVWGDRIAIACEYTMDPYSITGCPLLISGMGPAGWWSVNEVAFPSEDSEVTVSIYKVISSVGNVKFIAGEVIDNGEGASIVLHIPVYDGDVIFVLDPVWNKMEPLAEATILSATAADEADCGCRCTCKGKNCTCDCVCNEENCGDCPDNCTCGDCGSCVPIGDEHKWRGRK